MKVADGIVQDSKEKPCYIEAQMKKNYNFGPTENKTKSDQIRLAQIYCNATNVTVKKFCLQVIIN